MIDIFNEVKSRLTMQEVAQHYGFTPNRAGFIACPFHHEKKPSLKIYPGGRGFHCFACNRGGSVVDFVAELYGLDALSAVRRLNDEFRLCLPLDRPQYPAERREGEQAAQRRRELLETAQLFETWRGAMLDKLNGVFRMAHFALKDCQGLDPLPDAEARAVKWQAVVEYWADCLLSGDMAEQMSIFRDRKGVDALCDQVLNSTQTKSSAA